MDRVNLVAVLYTKLARVVYHILEPQQLEVESKILD